MVIFASAAAFAQTNQSSPSSVEKVEKVELNKLDDSKDAEYDMKGGETRKFELTVKEAGKLELRFPIYAPMFKSAAEVNAADNPIVRERGSNVTIQKSLEWKVKKGEQEIGSGTNVVKFAQLGNRIIPASVEYEKVMMQPGTYILEIKCEQQFSVCKDKAKLALLNPNEVVPDPLNLQP